MKDKFFCIGQIVRPRGLKGVCKVQLHTDIASQLKTLTEVYLEKDKKFAIESSQIESDFAYFKLVGIDDIDAAETMRGKFIYGLRTSIKTPKDRHFINDLINIEVFVGVKKLGTLIDVLQYGSADVYIVKTEQKGNVSFPALKKLVLKIDMDNNRMELDEKTFVEVAVYPD